MDYQYFDCVLLNRGGGYNPATGKFTCLEEGVFTRSFTWTVTSKPGRYCHTLFVIDDKPIEPGYLDIQSSKNHFLATKNVLVEMKKGNQDWIRIADNGNNYLWEIIMVFVCSMDLKYKF